MKTSPFLISKAQELKTFTLTCRSLFTSRGIIKDPLIEVKNGKVVRIEPQSKLTAEYNFPNHDLLPSGVDAQVHLRYPGQPEKETPLTAAHASLRGGIAAFLTMPNTKPVIDSPEILKSCQRDISKTEIETGIKVYWSAAITKGQLGQTCVDFDALKKAGALAFTDDGKGVESREHMREAFAFSARTNSPILQHAEFCGHGGILAPGPTQKKLGIPAYGDDPEWKMVERDLEVLKEYPGARYHVLHISSRKTVELLEKARNSGLKVSGEVSPHHLWYTSNDIPETDTSYKMNPPLRSDADRKELRAALVNGGIDFVATDHAPHELSAKKDFTQSSFGTTGLETALPVLLAFYKEKVISAERLVQVFSLNPAKFLRIDDTFGEIKIGLPFYGVLVDTLSDFKTVTESDLASLSLNNCFLGAKLGPMPSFHFAGGFLYEF